MMQPNEHKPDALREIAGTLEMHLQFISQRLDDFTANYLVNSDDELTSKESVHLMILSAILAAQQYDPVAIRRGWELEDIEAVVRHTGAIAEAFLRYHAAEV